MPIVDEDFHELEGTLVGVVALTRDPHPRMPNDEGQKWSVELFVASHRALFDDPTEVRRLGETLLRAATLLAKGQRIDRPHDVETTRDPTVKSLS